MTYGDEILIARREAGLYQKDLAKAVNVTPNTIVDLEKNKIEVTEETYLNIMSKIKELSENK